jgi:signal transduction histidine kinase
MLSLRARVFLGAALWSLGLFLFSGMVLTHYMLYVPQAPGIVHGVFIHYMIIVSLATIAAMVVGLIQVKRGLASFHELRKNLTGVREGRDARLGGEYPSEVQPLVTELNQLLSDREERVTRALTKAGDLAHGLKTPLTLLNQQAERAKAEGRPRLPPRSCSRSSACAGRSITTSRMRAHRHPAPIRPRVATSRRRPMRSPGP